MTFANNIVCKGGRVSAPWWLVVLGFVIVLSIIAYVHYTDRQRK